MTNSVRKILIIANLENDQAGILIDKIKKYFENREIQIFVYGVDQNIPESIKQSIEMAFSLGGDGTLLYCARLVGIREIPILAVNLGNFGFITEIASDEWQDVYEKYVAGRIGFSKRMLIKTEVIREGKTIHSVVGLNEAVIGLNGITHLINLKLLLSQSYVGRYRADGVIIATATGSTAYSMGAEGPILHPEMDAFILNPICPFTLSNRPLVIPGDEIIEIEVEKNKDYNLVLSIDGAMVFALKPNDRVVCCKASQKALILRSDKRNFYEVLRSKLNWSGEPHA